MTIAWVLTASAYSLLLPWWEGFDEPFHYGYAQSLAVERRWPELGRTPVSAELWRSLALAPGSHVVRRNLPFLTTFDQYFALPAAERAARSDAQWTIARQLRLTSAAGTMNYEAQQPPLAYLPLALVDVMAGPLPVRLAAARFGCAMAGGGLQLWLSLKLARAMGLAGTWPAVALFLITAAQMFHATFSRVSNDWLAVPLSTLVVLAAIRLEARPRPVEAGALGLCLALGLLTKAYFLVWTGFGLGLLFWLLLRRRADWRCAVALLAGLLPALPWYLRNVVLYGNVTGTIQARAGIGIADALRAAGEIPWPRTMLTMARGALWTGNNSFTSFSALTLDVVIVTSAVAVVWSLRRRGTWLVAAASALFAASLVYANAMFYAQSHASFYTATPWYAQAISAPLACLVVLGVASAGIAGRWMAGGLVVLGAYLNAATIWVKLIPLYSGCREGRMSLRTLAACYSGEWVDALESVTIGDVRWVLVLGLLASAASSICGVMLVRNLFRTRGDS